MLRTRVIPILLLKNSGLIKTKKFKKPIYIGDPINAVKIFNEKEVDELILLDVIASIENKGPDFDHISNIVSECFMPIAYGGGIRNLDDIDRLFRIGIEKVVLNSQAALNPELVKSAADKFGSQSIVVSVDVKKDLFGKYQCYILGGKKKIKKSPVDFCKEMESLGAGEICLSAIHNEGMMNGYDLKLTKMVSEAISIPLIANGGAGKVDHFREAIEVGKASAVSAGSMFVFHGPLRGILINFPTQQELKEKLFNYDRK